MEHSSHGCSERVVVRVEERRVVGAAAWSEGLGGSEQRFNGLVSENYQGGYRLEACRPGLIATCRADALHDLLAAELLQVVGRAGGTILCECLLAECTDACREIGSGEAVGSSRQGNDRFGDPAHARLVEIDAADYDLTDTGWGWQTLKCLIGDEA